MKPSLPILSLGAAAVALTAAAALVLHSAYGGGTPDPVTARCNSPTLHFGQTVARNGQREAAVRFTCAGAVLAGTVTLPPGPGPHPGVVFVHGAGEARRLPSQAPLVQAFVGAGIAVLSYDKRGVGESGGDCCPGDHGLFNLLAADADGAVAALRSRADIAPDRVGLVGASQAGWIVPVAALRSRGAVAFTALADGPAVSAGEERRWSELAGEDDPDAPALTPTRKRELERELGSPSGFDARPYVARLRTPGLWLYGGRDASVPADRSVATLRALRHENVEVVTYPRAGHGLLDVPPSEPRALPRLVAWVTRVAN